jgi:triacylglycerol lipase
LDKVFARLRALGDEFTPEQIAATRELFAPLVPRPAAGAQVHRDLRYGPDARNRLDVFTSGANGPARAVVVFVHGGGFIMGDKGDANAPFFNNFGAWAVREGFVGVTLTYRLAPDHVWPSGGEDLQRAVDWLKASIAVYGGDPRRIVLAGQSAGATHVASYLAGQGCSGDSGPGVAAAALFSGVFDLPIADRNGPNAAYYGADASLYAERSTVKALGSATTPCLFTVSELDPAQFHRQAAAVVNARLAATGRTPELMWLAGHNHVSSVMQLGCDVDTLGPPLARFVRRVTEDLA